MTGTAVRTRQALRNNAPPLLLAVLAGSFRFVASLADAFEITLIICAAFRLWHNVIHSMKGCDSAFSFAWLTESVVSLYD